jgi:Mn-dependent DtxR family transcriptional regulator
LIYPDGFSKGISEMVADALRGVAANPQVCPTIAEIPFEKHYSRFCSISFGCPRENPRE